MYFKDDHILLISLCNTCLKKIRHKTNQANNRETEENNKLKIIKETHATKSTHKKYTYKK